MSFIGALLDFISPRACLLCGERLACSEEHVCTVCNLGLPRTNYSETPLDNELARRFWGRFEVDKASSWIFYQAHSDTAKIIYDLKYHNKPEIGLWLGRIASTEMSKDSFFEGIDAIVPVPITRMRRWHRGYNQCHLIAEGISEVTGLPVIKNAVRRVKFSGSQTQKDIAQRLLNVENVFKLTKPELVRNKHILLIDDIITSGATIGSCADELSKAGNVTFSILSIGYTKS